ncbi:MAG TPA: hypothetical protein VM582_01815, partial [Candidatus Thermoplasmatota archaeon]|nr:hypothetical protein [Candidatus Thermoplasmatota archaeon]
ADETADGQDADRDGIADEAEPTLCSVQSSADDDEPVNDGRCTEEDGYIRPGPAQGRPSVEDLVGMLP